MARVKVWGYLDADDSLVDLTHESGLTQAGFDQVQRMMAGFDDIDSCIEEDD